MKSLAMTPSRPASPSCFPFVMMVVFFGLWLARMGLYNLVDQKASSYEARQFVSTAWRIAIWIVFPLLWLKLVERRPMRQALRPCKPGMPKYWPITPAVAMLVIVLGEHLLRGLWSGIPSNTPVAVLCIGTSSMAAVAVAEEFVFRGVFLSGLLARGWSYWQAASISSLCFALIHWPGWLHGTMTISMLAELSLHIFIFGFCMTALVRAEGGLKSAMIVHFFNNMISGEIFLA
jgi:membrane protease YdiL (CAAX protease family)